MATAQVRREQSIRSIEDSIKKLMLSLSGKPVLRIGSEQTLSVPGSSPRDTRRLAVTLRVLQLIHQALINDVVVTKRDIYYKDVELFGSQAVVDRVVDRLTAGFSTTRAALNVAAAAKGLVLGDVKINRRDGQVFVCNRTEPQLIPALEDHDLMDSVDVDWILVVEKEATFSALSSSGLLRGPQFMRGIMITGKGYPDLSTRSFLRRLSVSYAETSSPPRILALVDHDPDGIAIMSTYKHGSNKLRHENMNLIVPHLEWIGVKREDLVNTAVEDPAHSGPTSQRGLLSLTKRDREKAVDMLQAGVCVDGAEEMAWRAGLQAMLMTNVKAEIQLLEERPGGLLNWLEMKLAGNRSAATLETRIPLSTS